MMLRCCHMKFLCLVSLEFSLDAAWRPGRPGRTGIKLIDNKTLVKEFPCFLLPAARIGNLRMAADLMVRRSLRLRRGYGSRTLQRVLGKMMEAPRLMNAIQLRNQIPEKLKRMEIGYLERTGQRGSCRPLLRTGTRPPSAVVCGAQNPWLVASLHFPQTRRVSKESTRQPTQARLILMALSRETKEREDCPLLWMSEQKKREKNLFFLAARCPTKQPTTKLKRATLTTPLSPILPLLTWLPSPQLFGPFRKRRVYSLSSQRPWSKRPLSSAPFELRTSYG